MATTEPHRLSDFFVTQRGFHNFRSGKVRLAVPTGTGNVKIFEVSRHGIRDVTPPTKEQTFVKDFQFRDLVPERPAWTRLTPGLTFAGAADIIVGEAIHGAGEAYREMFSILKSFF